MELVETLVICLSESLAGCLTFEKIACLEPAKDTIDEELLVNGNTTYRTEARKKADKAAMMMPTPRRYLCHGCSERSSCSA